MKDEGCYTDKLYSMPQDELVEMFEDYQRLCTDSHYAVSAVCLDTEAGHKLCGNFFGVIPAATIEYSDSLAL